MQAVQAADGKTMGAPYGNTNASKGGSGKSSTPIVRSSGGVKVYFSRGGGKVTKSSPAPIVRSSGGVKLYFGR